MEAEQRTINLLYWREGTTETFSGTIYGVTRELHFTGSTLASMFGWVQYDLQQHPDYRLVMRRKEAAYPMTLPAGLEELIRQDPAAAAAALSPPPQRVVVGRSVKTNQVRRVVLRTGHDTLADAFGQVVYVVARKSFPMKVESPITGRWSDTYEYKGLLYCHEVRIVSDVLAQKRWVTMQVEDLLATNSPRYYLPRSWNVLGFRGWIDHQTLAEMYAAYQQEKASVSTAK